MQSRPSLGPHLCHAVQARVLVSQELPCAPLCAYVAEQVSCPLVAAEDAVQQKGLCTECEARLTTCYMQCLNLCCAVAAAVQLTKRYVSTRNVVSRAWQIVAAPSMFAMPQSL